MSDYKKNVMAAIAKYEKKHSVKTDYQKRHNQAPEKQVVHEIMIWAKGHGFDLSIIDSRAVYSPETRKYTSRTTSEVMPDIIGNMEHLAVYIEAKAPGKRSRTSDAQKMFLERKILCGCFACVADSVDTLRELWEQFLVLNPNEAKVFLLSKIP